MHNVLLEEKRDLHTNSKTSSQMWSMVDGLMLLCCLSVWTLWII